jgi:hypothetical protein
LGLGHQREEKTHWQEKKRERKWGMRMTSNLKDERGTLGLLVTTVENVSTKIQHLEGKRGRKNVPQFEMLATLKR